MMIFSKDIKEFSKEWKTTIKQEIEKTGLTPMLGILQVGESESSDRCVLCDRDNFDGWRHCFRVCCRYQ